ncbi:MAG: sialate O-acetylesterase [Sphingobacterium sp.]
MINTLRSKFSGRHKKQILQHYLSYGQSHGFGLNSGMSVLQKPLSDRIVMFNGGVSPASNSKETIEKDLIDHFVPAYNAKYRESPILSGAHFLSQQTDQTILCSNHGSGGTKIENLMRDSIQYQNMLVTIQRALDICTSGNVEYSIPPIMFFHGGANAHDSKAHYKEKILRLFKQLNHDIKQITGQRDNISFIMQQNIAGETGLAQIELAREMPELFRCQGPYYVQKFTDRFHLSSSGYIALGAYNARAALDSDWFPLYPKRTRIDGKAVTLEFHNPSGTALVLDDQRIKNYRDENYGFRWIDDSHSAKISTVTVVGADRVILELSNVPSGANPLIGIADVSEGSAKIGLSKRCCLRDSNSDVDKLGMPMYNWACIYRIPVVAA